MLGSPKGFLKVSLEHSLPVVIGSMIHYMLLLNVEVHFLRTLVKGMQILANYPLLFRYMVVILM